MALASVSFEIDQSTDESGLKRQLTKGSNLVARSASLACTTALADAKEDIQEQSLSFFKGTSNVAQGSLSFTEGVFALLLGVPGGAGALVPRMMKTLGFLTAPCILFCICFVAAESARLVSAGMTKLQLARGDASGPLRNYESYGRAVAGRLGYGFPMVFKVISMSLGCVLRTSFQTDAICTLLSTDRQSFVRFLVVMPVFMAFAACVKDLVRFARFSFLGLIGTAMLYLSIIIGGLMAANRLPLCNADVVAEATDCRRYAAFPENGFRFQDVAIISSVCFFNLFGAPLVASVHPKMAEPSQIFSCTRMAVSGLFVLYLLLMSLGYYGFGQNMSEQIIVDITHHSPLLGGLAAIGMIMNCAISAPMLFLIVVDTFESTGTSLVHTPLSIPNLVFRLGCIFILTLISWAVPYAAEVCGIMASVLSVSLNCLFPLLLHYYLRRNGTVPKDKQSLLRYVFHGLMVMLAVLFCVFGFVGSVNKLAMKLQADSERLRLARR